ncbi:MAG: hypothetical protein R2747_06770 [Pyrinomonadaceae bacterium]
MSLLELQNLLARIFTDEDLRRDFLADPEGVGLKRGLTGEEIKGLCRILPEEIESFSESLFFKRLREVERLLPLTGKVLGEDLEREFLRFSREFNPKTVHKHLEDALGFSRFLCTAELVPIWAGDLARYEAGRLEFVALEKRAVFIKMDFDLRKVRQTGFDPLSELKKRKTFAIWWRIGKKGRHFIF